MWTSQPPAPAQADLAQAGPIFSFEQAWGRGWGNACEFFFRVFSLSCSFAGAQLLGTLAQFGESLESYWVHGYP